MSFSNYTDHAYSRAKQRCFPAIVDEMLNRFGTEEFIGQGLVKIILTKQCFRNMRREWGRKVANSFMKYSGIYKVECVDTGIVITIGRITKRIKH